MVFPVRILCTTLLMAGLARVSTTIQPAAPEPLTITGITVIDVAAGRERADQSVVIAGNRIASIGDRRTISPPPGARVIDGRGRFVMPGLIDTHVHLGNAADRDQLRAVGPLLAHGVTGVRDAGASGQDAWLVALRDRVARGELVAPRLYVSGMIGGRTVARSGLESAGAFARHLVDLGVDGLKIRDGLTNGDIRAVVEVGAAAKRPVYGHTYDAATRERDDIYTLEAIRMGLSGTMHIMGMPQVRADRRPAPPRGPRFGDWQAWWIYQASLWRDADPAAERELVDAMVARRAWLEPTLITEDWIVNADQYRKAWNDRRIPGSFERMREGFPTVQGPDLQRYSESFTRMKAFVRRFHEAGGIVTAGTDCVPLCGYGIHDELRLLVEAGLTPAAALRAATTDAARVLGWADRVGSIRETMLADLVVLTANPLHDIRNVTRVDAVVREGRYLDRTTLDGLLSKAR
jgi:imidazolonepropionase-like amidohydrolase